MTLKNKNRLGLLAKTCSKLSGLWQNGLLAIYEKRAEECSFGFLLLLDYWYYFVIVWTINELKPTTEIIKRSSKNDLVAL